MTSNLSCLLSWLFFCCCWGGGQGKVNLIFLITFEQPLKQNGLHVERQTGFGFYFFDKFKNSIIFNTSNCTQRTSTYLCCRGTLGFLSVKNATARSW